MKREKDLSFAWVVRLEFSIVVQKKKKIFDAVHFYKPVKKENKANFN